MIDLETVIMETVMGGERSELALADFLRETEDGKLFRIEFVKRTTGERRVMLCRRGVRKGVKGVGMSYKPEEKNLLVVFDMMKRDPKTNERGAFRMVNLDDLVALRVHGKCYSWDRDGSRFREEI